MKNNRQERRHSVDRRKKARYHFSVDGGERRSMGAVGYKCEVKRQEISPYWPQAV